MAKKKDDAAPDTSVTEATTVSLPVAESTTAPAADVPAEAPAPEIAEATCKKCGESVSGPDAKAVKDTMARHTKKKHGLIRGR